jgi:hypothetical protein
LYCYCEARHKPVGTSSRHGYRTPRDAARNAMLNGDSGGGGRGGGGGSRAASGRGVAAAPPAPGAAKPMTVKKDEEHRECFIVGNEYEGDYPWWGGCTSWLVKFSLPYSLKPPGWF